MRWAPILLLTILAASGCAAPVTQTQKAVSTEWSGSYPRVPANHGYSLYYHGAVR